MCSLSGVRAERVTEQNRAAEDRRCIMAGSPRWKVYNTEGEYVASCKHVEDAAAIIALYGDGASIRDGHSKVVWLEGRDGEAAESFDAVAAKVYGED